MKIWKWIPLVIPILLVIIVLGTYVGDWESSTDGTGIDDFYNNDARFASLPTALIVPDTNPYYTLNLIAVSQNNTWLELLFSNKSFSSIF